jgi:hypothetical protein
MAIPYITTKAEVRRRRMRIMLTVVVALAVIGGASVAAYIYMPPLDLIIAKARVGILK